MINYYQILGIAETASLSEIKSSFRRLAKLYHPDKNPGGHEEFKKIFRAYEILSNPTAKNTYDHKLRYHRNAATQKATVNTGRKNWSFEEREMKRRQYYNDYIKQFEKSTGYTKASDIEIKSTYNEYKYILFATPIAVALFLLIMNLATGNKPRSLESHPAAKIKRVLHMGDAPYIDHFGTQLFFAESNKSITIKNHTGGDIIVCLFTDDKFLRSCYIENGYYAEIPQLPQKPIEVRYTSGKNWVEDQYLKEVNLYGAFSKDLEFYKSAENSELGGLNELTLTDQSNEGFTQVGQKEFFNKN